MNSELFTLFWYTRAELSLIRKQLNCLSEKKNDNDIQRDDTVSLRKEVDDIMRGVIQTLDDILYTESLIVNTLFLSHIIQSFTVHLSNLQATLGVAEKRGITIFSLDSNIVRINCFITTLISIARANLVILCTTTTQKLSISNTENISNNKKRSIPPMYQTRTPSILQTYTKRNDRSDVLVCTSPNIQGPSTRTHDYLVKNLPVFEPNKSHTAPLLRVHTDDLTTPRDSNTDPPSSRHSTSGSVVNQLHPNQPRVPPPISRMGSSRTFAEEKIDQVTRLTIHLTSKDMLTSHEQAKVAIQNSVTENIKSPPSSIQKSRGMYFDETRDDKKETKKNWSTAKNVVRTMARLRVLGDPSH